MSLKRKEDLALKLEYKTAPVPYASLVLLPHHSADNAFYDSGYPTDLYEVSIAGISEALANLTEAGATEPMVKINVFLSESGLVTVQDAVVHGEIKDTTLTGTSPCHKSF